MRVSASDAVMAETATNVFLSFSVSHVRGRSELSRVEQNYAELSIAEQSYIELCSMMHVDKCAVKVVAGSCPLVLFVALSVRQHGYCSSV